jgi:hypothetical protein
MLAKYIRIEIIVVSNNSKNNVIRININSSAELVLSIMSRFEKITINAIIRASGLIVNSQRTCIKNPNKIFEKFLDATHD